MKEAFRRGDYEALQQLAIKHPISNEANFYLGILAENGLDGEINLEEALKYYSKAFNSNPMSLESGIALARIQQKKQNLNAAEEIYTKIAILPNPTNNLSIEYAKYRLARINAKGLLEQDEVQAEDIQKILNSYNAFLKNSALAEDSPVRVKAIYHKALIELRWSEELIKNVDLDIDINKFKDDYFHKSLTNNKTLKIKYDLLQKEYEQLKHEEDNQTRSYYNFSVDNSERIEEISTELTKIKNDFFKKNAINITKELKRIKKGNLTDVEIKSGFNDAKKELVKISYSYPPAAAELLNLEAKALIKEQKYDEAITKTKEALKLNKKNVNALIIQAKAHLRDNSNNPLEKNKDIALELVRKALNIDPINQFGLDIRDRLKAQLVKEIAQKTIQHIKDKTSKIDGYLTVWTANREEYIKKLTPFIEESLNRSNFLTNHAPFKDIDKISNILSELVLNEKDANKNIEYNIKNNVTNPTKELSKNIEQKILQWDNEKVGSLNNSLSEEENQLLDKRKKFKKEIVYRLGEYYKRCYALTQPNTDITIKDVDGLWGSVGDIAQTTGSFAAAVSGSVIPSIIGAAVKGASAVAEDRRKNALIHAAKKFCEIGKRDDKLTLEAFERVADQLVERYGMQIDNIQLDSIKDLAQVGTEKMLHQVREASIAAELLETLGKPLKTVENLVKYAGGLEAQKEYTTEEILLRGIVEGKQKSSDPTIINTEQTKRGGEWLAHEVFELPAITSNGREFYARIKPNKSWLPSFFTIGNTILIENTTKYGAIYIPENEIRDSYQKIPNSGNKSVSGYNRSIITKELDQHLNLINNSAWISPEVKEKNKKAKVIQDGDLITTKIDNAEENKWTGIVKIIAGTFTLGCVKIIGSALLVGAIASGVGIPIAIGAACIGGAALLSGIKDYSEARRESQKLMQVQKEMNQAIKEGTLITESAQNHKLKEKLRARQTAFHQRDDMYISRNEKSTSTIWSQLITRIAKAPVEKESHTTRLRESAKQIINQNNQTFVEKHNLIKMNNKSISRNN